MNNSIVYFCRLSFISLALCSAASVRAEVTCPKKEKVVAVNIAFNYFAPENIATHLKGEKGAIDFLYETKDDLVLYRKLTARFASANYEVTDQAPAAQNRATFIAKLKDWTKKAEAVHLNYSGHGVITDKGEWAIALPNLNSRDCVGENVPVEELQSLLKQRGLEAKQYRGLFGETFVKEARGGIKVENKSVVVAPDVPGTREAWQKAKSQVQSIETVKDSGPCSNYLVPISEIQKAIGDKNVFGIVDSCYAGAIHEGSQMAVLAPVTSVQKATSVSYVGGYMTSRIRQNLALHNCRNAGERVTIEDLYANSAVPSRIAELRSAGTNETIDSYEISSQSQSPKVAVNSASACFDYSVAAKDLRCPVPTRLSMKVTGGKFKPYSGLGEERTDCEMNGDEEVDPKTIESTTCPPRILLVGLKSRCSGWVRLSSLTGKEVKCEGMHPEQVQGFSSGAK